MLGATEFTFRLLLETILLLDAWHVVSDVNLDGIVDLLVSLFRLVKGPLSLV